MTQTPATHEGARSTYRYAYYLFLEDATSGCEQCYVPLLVTTEPLEQAAKAKENAAGVVITTFERDSIWHNDGIVSIAPGDIETDVQIVRFRNKKYRYQEISSAEALKLFEHPRGTIPISRPELACDGSIAKYDGRSPRLTCLPAPTLEDLISDFRSLQ